jgi:hypothetical protein
MAADPFEEHLRENLVPAASANYRVPLSLNPLWLARDH